MHLCLEFQEEYKRLDRLCKECLGTEKGVSDYIEQMELVPWNDRRYVTTWENDYQCLKHIRWVRNQLAHVEGTLTSDICVKEDLLWVKDFYRRIIRQEDPFGLIRKAKATHSTCARKQGAPTKTVVPPTQIKKAKSSLWQRVIARIRKMFR